MQKIVSLVALSLFLFPLALQAGEESPEELKKDAQAHREFAGFHLQAAACLESGKPHDLCEAELKKACKGKASGPHCGMKHDHEH